MFRRQRKEGFYTYPDHKGRLRRLLWRLGFDPLTVYERLDQTEIERNYYKQQFELASTHPSFVVYDGGSNSGNTYLYKASKKSGFE